MRGPAGERTMQDSRIETLFSLSGELPAAEPEPARAEVALLRSGALVQGSIREACFVRKLSGGGAVLHADAPATPGDRLELEIAGGQLLAGTVAWREGGAVGLSFDEPLDVFAVIARDLVHQPGERRRMPRIELRCPARLDADGRSERVHIRDVSQGGAKIELHMPLVPGTAVELAPDGFRAISGTVRWCDGGLAGIQFDPELGWQELMPWLRERRDSALRGRAAPAVPILPPHPLAPAPAEPSAPAEASLSLNLPARVREGTRRWAIEVESITTHDVRFESFAALRLGTLLWVVLPGLEGWPARVVDIDGYVFTCAFTQPLHPAVLERVLAAARNQG